MSDELAYLDATALAALIRARELSPVALLAALRARAAELDPRLGALVTPFEDAEARALDAERAVARGEAVGPLHGVPVTLKDCIDTAGVRTMRGSRLFATRVPAEDATVVTRLRAAGAIPIAKTNLPEFALWWETDNLVSGRTSNPWDVTRTAGGSSGGEAAAIAAGLSPLGLGSDLGGSIRTPAHACGVVGLKPTHGLVPLTGHWPDCIHRYMHVGPMARTVRDAALALSLLAGPDGRDWYAVPAPPPRPLAGTGESAGLRVCRLADSCFGPVDPEVSATVGLAVHALAAGGAAVVETTLPALAENDWHARTLVLYGAEAGPFFEPILRGREEELHPVLRRRLADRLPSTLEEYVEAELQVERLRRELAGLLRAHDVVLCPVSVVPAPRHDSHELEIGGQTVPGRSVLRATLPFDLTGSPALSVPFGRTEAGLPVGVQVVGRRFEDETVLRVGMALEEARGPLEHPPL